MDTNNRISSEPSSSEALVEMTRLNNLSDGVFAIPLTLLAFDLRLPEGVPTGDLPTKLLELAPKLLVFLISFVVIGGAWGSHQRLLRQIPRGDGLLVWFNLFCLLCVALLPAAAAVLGRYPTAFLPIAFFALDVALIQLTALWLWQHASQSGLINPTLDPRVVVSISRRLKLSTFIFALTIPLALWNAWIIYVFWIGLFLFLFTTDWLSWQQAARTQQTSFPLEDIKRARIHVEHGEGLLQIDSKAEGHKLFNGVFGGGLASRMDRSGEAANVQLGMPERWGLLSRRYPWTWGPENVLDWTLHLSDRVPLALEVSTSNGISTLELGASQITDLKVVTVSGKTEIYLPHREGQTTVHIQSKTAYFTVHVPPDVAAHIHCKRDYRSEDIDLDRFPLMEQDGEYRSANYETALKRVDILMDYSTSFVKIV